MSTCVDVETGTRELSLAAALQARQEQPQRILAALGLTKGSLPKVDPSTLWRYYAYLSAKIAFPFFAYYPDPWSAGKQDQRRRAILELLDPSRHLGGEFDGIFCKTRAGKYEVNLPLIELYVPQDDPNFQLIEDYWYWFWNWR